MSIGGSTAATELADMTPRATKAPAISQPERLRRMERARALTDAVGANALLVNAGASLRYFAGVPWRATERLVAMLLPVRGRPVLVCPRFELGSLQADLLIDADIRLWEEDENPFSLVADTLLGERAFTLAIDPALPFQMAERLRHAAPGVALVDGGSAIDGCRMHKSSAEIALMQQAKEMTLDVHRRAARIMAPGISTTEVKRFIDEAHRALGAAGSGFCIVQFGRATAFPHGLPGEQHLAEGDLVLIDTGCTVEGYHSDITRTYSFGTPTAEERAIWDLEKEAQAAAFAAARPGAACESVDAAARVVLERGGLGPDYRLPGLPHRTAPATASAYRSTSPLSSSAAIVRRSRRGCVFRTSR